MFRDSSAHLQEDTVVHMQHVVLSILYESSWWPVGTQPEWELTGGGRLLVGVLRQFSLKLCTDRQPGTLIESDYHMLHVYNYILLKMNTWGSKHVQENSFLWINNNQCTKVGN